MTGRRLLALGFFVALASGYGQISPGRMSKPHSEWGGPTQCTACHSFGLGASKFKCLDCHGEIGVRLKQRKGFHAKVANFALGTRDCVRCHAEHLGPDFYIIKWDTIAEEFDHRRTGYLLEGKHARLSCRKCHTPKFVQPEDRKLIRTKDPGRTYLGLSPACTSCHADEHKGQLGADCRRCHSMNAWKPAQQFDHDTANFKLTGLHQQVTCVKCHKATEAGGKNPSYKGIPFASCSNCHQDPHHGSFAQVAKVDAAFKGECESCHDTSGWKHPRMAGFNHSSTKFALHGKHADVVCAKCHLNGANFDQPVAHALCADCHRDDPHEGQFARRQPSSDCGECHNEDGYKPSTYTLDKHQRSPYVLTGRHVKVECAACHIPHGKQTRYLVVHDNCTDCHKDSHGRQFAAAPFFDKCDSCHTVEGYRPSTYTAARHARTKFALSGAHGATACAECHRAPHQTGAATSKIAAAAATAARIEDVAFHFTDVSCKQCHEDPHSTGQIRKLANAGACTGCHTVQDWKHLAGFDHKSTGYDLTGSHRGVGCLDCHKPVRSLVAGAVKIQGSGAAKIPFHTSSGNCAECHDDIHAGQFKAGDDGSGCARCHVTMSWKAANFNHDRTQFSLGGAHRSVPCRSCHPQVAGATDARTLQYKGVPTKCASCHSETLKQ